MAEKKKIGAGLVLSVITALVTVLGLVLYMMNCKTNYFINSGVNIPKEDLDKLFTPFYRVEKSHNRLTGGSGLGLYLVKIILEQHNLSFKIENINDSVCFEITLNSQNLNQN